MPEDSPPSQTLGPYKLLRQLGRGGQATVYLAEDTRLHRQVALKVLDPGFAADRTGFERFRREAEITSRLDHPGICTVYETGETRGYLWIAMRYVDGESLAKKISTAKESPHPRVERSFVLITERGDDSPRKENTDSSAAPRDWTDIAGVLATFEQIARALHVAHEHGVIHRDIKPGNLVVTKSGEPVILDFGLAQEVAEEHQGLTRTGDIMGTPAYMSPEQVAAQRIRLDRRTDVYSLGVSLFECLTLKRPFDSPTRDGLYQAILTKDPPDPRTLNPSLPRDLKIVLEAALEKDRDRRYQTALDFAEDLHRVRVHEPILAKPVGSIVRLRRWIQRNPALATALIGLFVALATGMIIALVLLDARNRAFAQVTQERNAKVQALAQVTTERNEKEAALSDYDRLGDLSRLEALIARADELWPAESAKVAAMKAWIDEARELAQQLDGHRNALDALRESRALPYSVEDHGRDIDSHGIEVGRLDELREQREDLQQDVKAAASGADSRAASGPPLDQLRATLARLDEEMRRLETTIHERRTWRFDSTSTQFKHDTIEKLVTRLTAFLATEPRDGTLAAMDARLNFAESVERETIGRYETKWADAARSILDENECPKYGGLKIKPQVGLIPIGKDPASGLWEFVHLQTAAAGTDPVPARGSDGRLQVTEGMGLVFVLIPGGSFRMGTKPEDFAAESQPAVDTIAREAAHEVPLGPFFLSKYEMTQGQWLRIATRNPSRYSDGNPKTGKPVDLRNPVESVTWLDCERWLSRMNLVLPTEAQWEYAARAGTTTLRWTGPGTGGLAAAENLSDAYAKNHGGTYSAYESWNDGYTVHAPVGSLASNPFGLHDVLGNVMEWCRDWYGSSLESHEPGDGYRPSKLRKTKIVRGGAFSLPAAKFARSAYRGNVVPDKPEWHIGVRPARRIAP